MKLWNKLFFSLVNNQHFKISKILCEKTSWVHFCVKMTANIHNFFHLSLAKVHLFMTHSRPLSISTYHAYFPYHLNRIKQREVRLNKEILEIKNKLFQKGNYQIFIILECADVSLAHLSDSSCQLSKKENWSNQIVWNRCHSSFTCRLDRNDPCLFIFGESDAATKGLPLGEFVLSVIFALENAAAPPIGSAGEEVKASLGRS